tara:strand:- start:249 stop:434 length:186 start_codon:yes stop_codon:yes gene_type:complete
MGFDSDKEAAPAQDFTAKYIELLSNDLFLSRNECERIIDADTMTEEEMLAIKTQATLENPK